MHRISFWLRLQLRLRNTGVGHLARFVAVHLKSSQSRLGITGGRIFGTASSSRKRYLENAGSQKLLRNKSSDNHIAHVPTDAAPVLPSLGTKQPLLFEIVANVRDCLDVDKFPKFDYIARDCHVIEVFTSIFINRLISSACDIDHKICYDIKDANKIYVLDHTHFSLHKQVYNHKTTKAIEYMVTDALLAAEPHLELASLVNKPDGYVPLTDNLLNEIQESTRKVGV
ncbi:hypothetical protein EDD15DRAFT_2372086 [Pisolithus albus]|nr:hypothetical protein EDD15DRAFT_2372086 [Pisolithus albus]